MDFFRNAIRKVEYASPSEVDIWIQDLENGHDDPVLASVLGLLPSLYSRLFLISRSKGFRYKLLPSITDFQKAYFRPSRQSMQ